MYEEDETVQAEDTAEKIKLVEPQKTASEIEVMLVPKYTEALAQGLNALTLSNLLTAELPVEGAEVSPFDRYSSKKISLGSLQPKEDDLIFIDKYNLHALPYVIGTPEFHEDENCGVFYLSDEGIIHS